VVSLYYARWLSLFLEFMQQWLPGFAEKILEVRPGRAADHSPILVLLSWKRRAIPLLSLRAFVAHKMM